MRELLGELGSNRVLKKAEFRVGAKERRELKATVGWAHTVAERIIKADSSLPDNESVPAAAETARGADVNQENKIDFKREVVLQLKDAWSDTRKGERHEHHAGVGREIRLERHHKYERLGILDGFGGALDVLSRGIADKLGQVHT